MPVGFRNSAGVDFDSLFDPFVTGSPPANTGFRDSAGVDLAGQYAPIAFGSKGPDVGFRTSGGVDVSNLWAALGTAAYANISNQTLVDEVNGGSAEARYELGSNGIARKNQRISGTWSMVAIPGEWLTTGIATDYEVRATLLSGTTPNRPGSASVGTWLSLGTTRYWGLSTTVPQTLTCSLLVEIRRASSGVVLDSATIGMTAIRDL
jgi:hypothetical protein